MHKNNALSKNRPVLHRPSDRFEFHIARLGLRVTLPVSRFALRQWLILGFFSLLTVIMLFPLSVHLAGMVPEPTDPLLNGWRMQWNVHAFLTGPAGIANLFNTNIFYPFPLTLAYSEHFLMITAQALPFLLLTGSHLFGMNLSVLITFVLSGYAMYLLITAWTGQPWAGIVAGVLFAFSPQRFGQLNHLELLVTQWLPLTLLALHWTLTRPGLKYPLLFGLFFNLQALSGFHFALNLTIACVLLALVYTLAGRVYWRPGLWLAALLSIVVTALLNWPIWRMYLRFSDIMGAVRTPGEVRIYSAALTDYLTTLPHNLLYGWTFGRWQSPDHQFQPLMPVGIVGLLLAISAFIYLIKSSRRPSLSNPDPNPQHLHFAQAQVSATRNPHSAISNTQRALCLQSPISFFLLLLTFLALILSFGLNENALGSGLAPLLKLSPYGWLYDHVSIFQGIRVPARYGILVVVGLTALAGWGVAYLLSARPWSSRSHWISKPGMLAFGLTALILLESWSAPLVGPEFPAGEQIAPVYHWLRQATSPDTVVLELPYQDSSEFIYEYYSSYHWRPLANGGTGFTPPIYKELRQWFNAFPDPRSVDVIRQMGIDLVILHLDSYAPDEQQRVLAALPLYLPAIERIDHIGPALVLHMAPPTCRPEPALVQATLTPTELDGLPNAVEVTYHNRAPAAFVADVRQTGSLIFNSGTAKNFTEPLVTPAGESQAVIVPLQHQASTDLSQARLPGLDRTVSAGQEPSSDAAIVPAQANNDLQWQPLGLQFAEGPQLVAFSLNPQTPTACDRLAVALDWAGGQPGDTALLQLLDPFGQVVAESTAQPWQDQGQDQPDVRMLPLAGSLPAGRYGLRISVRQADGSDRWPITAAGVTIPPDQVPPLPVVIHPAPRPVTGDELALTAPPLFGEAITLTGRTLAQDHVSAGDWLRFSLVWQIDRPLAESLTVFTQLIGPDGQVWGQRDNQPGGGWYDVSLWLPGQPVVDDYAFQIQPDAPPGTYRLIAGLYRSDTLERLTTQTGADFVEIGSVVVE